MSFTRFHDDPARIKKQVAESTFAGRYHLNVPGMGINMPFEEDPQLRLQKWGANLTSNIVNLESDFWGLSRPLNRDLVEMNDYKTAAARAFPIIYESQEPYVQESRASCPAWTFRSAPIERWEQPWVNPQANTELRFPNNIQTRILEKDYYQPTIPVMSNNNNLTIRYNNQDGSN